MHAAQALRAVPLAAACCLSLLLSPLCLEYMQTTGGPHQATPVLKAQWRAFSPNAATALEPSSPNVVAAFGLEGTPRRRCKRSRLHPRAGRQEVQSLFCSRREEALPLPHTDTPLQEAPPSPLLSWNRTGLLWDLLHLACGAGPAADARGCSCCPRYRCLCGSAAHGPTFPRGPHGDLGPVRSPTAWASSRGSKVSSAPPPPSPGAPWVCPRADSQHAGQGGGCCRPGSPWRVLAQSTPAEREECECDVITHQRRGHVLVTASQTSGEGVWVAVVRRGVMATSSRRAPRPRPVSDTAGREQ